ncbi:16S rRNA (guanine(527)-N(7))-methyltransferase RsmG [Aquabacter spiritensis]|uniref:Ribosomal RNA small subunit methyltransferase G n=1 Tax=Aquabacter spiritensis TaxID=933073 RepID=A0A4R3M035_9HYPH|nr:16S rRNA (guanine(527)-N(7))-methyltransferase RsmG [Aquabacter spiritensis]TCT05936.1 16S rRNA (guanine527-N7)-methyltransferase [Aquabacter spiritensis]
MQAVEAAVSRETFARLQLVADLLTHWQKTINLVAPASLPHLWSRHIADSLQLLRHAPDCALSWVDLGSGGGFPGLVVAAGLAERTGSRVALVESDTRKAAFLREAARRAGLPVRVYPQRIEQVAGELAAGTEVVSARALAPLPKLLDLAAPFLAAGAMGLFPKGKDLAAELTAAHKDWTLDIDLLPSLSDPDGRIVRVARATRAAPFSAALASKEAKAR